jgi:hypothetical protein
MAKGILDELKSLIDPSSYKDVIVELDKAALSALKQFGQGQAMAQKMRESIADATKGVMELGGDMNKVLEIQKDVSSTLGRNITVSAQASKDLFATTEVTGQSVRRIVEGMADVGISSIDATKEMKKVVDIARESGVNAQSVSENVLSNMEALNKYNFEGGVSGLAKMAAQATMLRINMNQTLQFAEKVFDPEGAIKVAASLQRLGVAQSDLLDPLRLMDLSQNDPAELQNQIVKMSQQFVQLGKDGNFEIMPGAKRQLREISEAMGISYNELTKMALGSADLDKKLKEIKFPDTFTKEQKNLIANMAQMKDGKYVVSVDGKEKEVGLLDENEIKKLEEAASKAPPTMEELAKEQVGFLDSIDYNIAALVASPKLGIAASKPVGTGIEAIRDVGKAVTKIPSERISPKGIREEINKMAESGKPLSELSKFMTTELKTSFVNAKTELDKLTDKYPIIGNAIDYVKNLAETTIQGNDVLKLPGQSIKLLPEDTFAAFTKGEEVLSKLGKGGESKTTSTPSTDSNLNIRHTLDINITAPSNINTNQLVEMFKNTDVSQALGTAVKESFNNGGLTSPTSNKQQLFNPGVKQYA